MSILFQVTFKNHDEVKLFHDVCKTSRFCLPPILKQTKSYQFREQSATWYNGDVYDDSPVVSILEAVDYVLNGNMPKSIPNYKEVSLGEYVVKVVPKQDIKVGCQTITAAQITEFIKAWNK